MFKERESIVVYANPKKGSSMNQSKEEVKETKDKPPVKESYTNRRKGINVLSKGRSLHQHKMETQLMEGIRRPTVVELSPIDLIFQHKAKKGKMNFHYIISVGWKYFIETVKRNDLYIKGSWLLAFESPWSARD